MYQLSTSLPYLLNRLGVRLGVLFTERIQAYDVTLPMYRVLAVLSERPDQKLNELSANTTVEMSTMSRLIGTMVTRGLVSRIRLPEDERTVRINLTPEGAGLAATLSREAQHYEDVAISALKSREVDRLRADIVRIYDALDILESELVTRAPIPAPAPAGASVKVQAE